MSSAAQETLAIFGGPAVRRQPMPTRQALEEADVHAAVAEVFSHYTPRGLDYGYQGIFEERYTQAFIARMGGGHADAVATGTASIFVALSALGLPRGSQVLVSPITDPGTINAILLAGLVPRLMDSMPGSYNVGMAQFRARLTADVRAAVVVHVGGKAADIADIVDEARKHGILVVEDCSQAHGASHKGMPVGSFGDIAAFSAMSRKAHVMGGCGGVVYCRDEALYRLALAHADRGKPMWREDFVDNDPTGNLFPALNLNADELSCAIGLRSLAKLSDTIRRRLAYVQGVAAGLGNGVCRPLPVSDEDSPFFQPISVDLTRISCDKQRFAESIRAEGISLNPHYKFLVCDWPWARQYLADAFDCVNARACQNTTFNLYVNENYKEQEVTDTIDAIHKVERYYTSGP